MKYTFSRAEIVSELKYEPNGPTASYRPTWDATPIKRERVIGWFVICNKCGWPGSAEAPHDQGQHKRFMLKLLDRARCSRCRTRGHITLQPISNQCATGETTYHAVLKNELIARRRRWFLRRK